MQTKTTNGIKITVIPTFIKVQKKGPRDEYVHAYEVGIQNIGQDTVQLLRRRWLITEGDGVKTEVEGEGVVGEQPVIKPNGEHFYNSWCPLNTEIGTMEGAYLMENLSTHEQFWVDIPRFHLIYPAKLS